MTVARKDCRGKMGYSLVEVSLALLVAAIGLLTIFALIPDGLGSSRKSVDLTETSAFADYVFASLDGMASSTNPVVWSLFKNGGTNLPLTSMLYGVTNIPPVQPYIFASNLAPQVFFWMPAFYDEILRGVTKYHVATFTYSLDIGDSGTKRKYARLEVWPGDVKEQVQNALNTNGLIAGSTVFYREYRPLK